MKFASINCINRAPVAW